MNRIPLTFGGQALSTLTRASVGGTLINVAQDSVKSLPLAP